MNSITITTGGLVIIQFQTEEERAKALAAVGTIDNTASIREGIHENLPAIIVKLSHTAQNLTFRSQSPGISLPTPKPSIKAAPIRQQQPRQPFLHSGSAPKEPAPAIEASSKQAHPEATLTATGTGAQSGVPTAGAPSSPENHENKPN